MVGQLGAGLASFRFHLQPELDQAAIAAKPFAQREATAALSHGMDPLVQSHCYFPFAFSPTQSRAVAGFDQQRRRGRRRTTATTQRRIAPSWVSR
jgi:hypothetical protein